MLQNLYELRINYKRKIHANVKFDPVSTFLNTGIRTGDVFRTQSNIYV